MGLGKTPIPKPFRTPVTQGRGVTVREFGADACHRLIDELAGSAAVDVTPDGDTPLIQ